MHFSGSYEKVTNSKFQQEASTCSHVSKLDSTLNSINQMYFSQRWWRTPLILVYLSCVHYLRDVLEVRGQPAKVSSLLPTCGTGGFSPDIRSDTKNPLFHSETVSLGSPGWPGTGYVVQPGWPQSQRDLSACFCWK